MTVSLRFAPFVVLLLFTLGADHLIIKEQRGTCMRHACSARAPFWRSGFVGFLLLTIFFGSPGSVFAQTVSSNCDNATPGDPIHCVIDGDAGETGDVSIDVENVSITATESGVAGNILNRGNSGNVTIKVNGGVIGVTGDYPGIHSRLTADGKLLIDVQNVDSTTNGAGANGVHAVHLGAGDVVILVRDGSIVAGGHVTSGGVYAHQDGPGDGNVDVRITNAVIETEDGGGVAAYQAGRGSGDIYILVAGGSITTGTSQEMDPSADPTGSNSDHGVVGIFFNVGFINVGGGQVSGVVTIDVRDVDIVTNSLWANGIYGVQEVTGDLVIRVRGGSITTKSTALDSTYNLTYAHGIYADHGGTGDIDIDLTNGLAIETAGKNSYGILAHHRAAENINLDIRGGSVKTAGESAHGIYGKHDGTGDIVFDVRDGTTVTTKGVGAHGIYGKHDGTGDIDFNVRNATIVTESIDLDPTYEDTFSNGIHADHTGIGDIDLDLQGGSIETKGVNSYGIYGTLRKVDHGGTISIRTSNGNDITTTGGNAHGIVAYNYGTMDTSAISIDVEGDIHASGPGAQGVRVGAVNALNVVERVAAIGTDGYRKGYRKQTVTVNGRVMGNAAGVYLAGGGRVVIGPKGSVGAKSGIAILATGDTPGANPGDSIIKPKLYLDMNLDGRRVARVIGNNWIINDGGETTIAVNNIVLHEGATGIVTDAVAHNGAWNVRMRAEGVTVTDRNTDPWTISAPAANVFADRDFSVQDFMQALASAQVDRAQCGDSTLTTQAPITNEEAASSTTDLSVNADGVKISATGAIESGIDQVHRGDGDITVNVRRSCVETTGAGGSGHEASGILANSDSDTDPLTNVGKVKVDVRDSTIMTQGRRAKGIAGVHTHTGDVDIDVENAAITTEGGYVYAIYGSHTGNGGIDIDVENTTIMAPGEQSRGVFGFHRGIGDVNITANNVDITTNSRAIVGWVSGLGDTTIDVQNSFIDTTDRIAYGIHGYHVGVTSAAAEGDIDIDVENTTITTAGANAYGIYGWHDLAAVVGDAGIDVENTAITTWGETAHGIYGRHTSGMGAFDIKVLNGSLVHAIGAGASGVRVGGLDNNGEVEDASGLDEDGYRKQTVTVNGRVMGNDAGVYLAGGGRVVIGPQGSVGAQSGIAILATGDTPGANPGDPVIKPKLHVDMNLDGRRVAQVIGNDWIMNDQGETTIAVNGTVLHKGATDEGAAGGVTGLTAPNGAWNVTMREKGVTVDRTDPASWVISAPATGVVVDRDFSTQDFTETRRPRPPAPLSSCPDGQVGTPPDCADAETEMPTEMRPPMFTEEYAPRAALYESLPGFLLRLRSQSHTGARLVSPESPVWLALSTGSGSVDPSRSTTGADYDLDRIEVQAGRTMDLGKYLTGWAALHHAQGESEVSSPTGGGDIDAKGRGVSIGALWSNAGGYYLDGSASWTDYYDIDFSSDDLGRLKSNVDALGTSFGLETGRRMVIGETFQMTPRAWLSHSSIDIDSFTDAVGARASFSDEVRLIGGIGASAQTMRGWKGGQLTWHGSLDLEQMLNSRSTGADVSGEKLKSETVSTRMLLGLGSLYRRGNLSISTQVSVDGLGTDDEDYSGQVNIGVRL